MKLTKQQVKYVAKLANLPISEKEEELYGPQLSKILEYIDQLNSVDTTGVEPTFNVSTISNIMRTDEVISSLSHQEATANAKLSRDGYFITKGVFEES